CKFSLYEGGLRLPFIVRWPGVIPAGKTDSVTVMSAVDVFPSMCNVAGAKLPKDVAFDGLDRLAALRGTTLSKRERPLMWEYGRNEKFFGYPSRPVDRSPNLAIRDGKWKLLINADGSGRELYDMSTNPREEKNVATDHPAEALRLQNSILDWR